MKQLMFFLMFILCATQYVVYAQPHTPWSDGQSAQFQPDRSNDYAGFGSERDSAYSQPTAPRRPDNQPQQNPQQNPPTSAVATSPQG